MFIVLPRNFKTINSTLTEFMLGDGMKDCEVLIDNYLNHIEKNHLYIEHTLQPAYTAGLYYIFQNGMVQSPISANSSSSQQNSLQFAGNIQDMYVQVSIPTTNLLLALAGCALIVVCGITVVAIARRGKVIEHGSAATATEALTNSGKFLRSCCACTFTTELVEAQDPRWTRFVLKRLSSLTKRTRRRYLQSARLSASRRACAK